MKTCMNCGASNPDTARACLECSYPLGNTATNSADSPQKYIPTRQQHTGIISNLQQSISENVYQSEVKKYISPKDGKTHVLMINSFSKWINQVFGVETKYTVQIDNIITAMQADGYEIIDIKFSTEQNQGLFHEMEGFYTMILYK